MYIFQIDQKLFSFLNYILTQFEKSIPNFVVLPLSKLLTMNLPIFIQEYIKLINKLQFFKLYRTIQFCIFLADIVIQWSHLFFYDEGATVCEQCRNQQTHSYKMARKNSDIAQSKIVSEWINNIPLITILFFQFHLTISFSFML